MQVEIAVLRRLRRIIQCLHEVNLSPEDGQALLRRLETNRVSPEDCEVLIQVIRATTEVSEHLSSLPEAPVSTPLSPERKAKRKRQAAKVARRRNRR